MINDLEMAYKALSAKVDRYSILFNYADGNQPLIYSTDRLREVFKNINAHFNQNWLSVVIESALDRLQFKGWSTDDEGVNEELEHLYSNNQIALEADDAHKGAMITHESFVIAWKGEGDQTEVYYNDPRMCHVFYEADNPKKKSFACKWYIGDDKYYRLILYYPDKIEYYKSNTQIKSGIPKSAGDFVPEVDNPVAINPFGEIPVFHFRTDRRSKNSDITSVITLQDAVNKLLADMMVSAEFGAFKQRYIITNSDTRALKNAPNEIWTIPSGDGVSQTSVGEFAESNLDNFLNAIDKLANSIAIISRTPKHYFYGQSGNISGEALIAMESPLISKVERHQRNFGVTWQELGHFLLKMNGIEIPIEEIELIWEPAQAVQPLTEAQTIKANTEAGIPLESALRWSGKNEYEIMKIVEDISNERKNRLLMAQAALEKARIEQEQSNMQSDGSVPEEEIEEI